MDNKKNQFKVPKLGSRYYILDTLCEDQQSWEIHNAGKGGRKENDHEQDGHTWIQRQWKHHWKI